MGVQLRNVQKHFTGLNSTLSNTEQAIHQAEPDYLNHFLKSWN